MLTAMTFRAEIKRVCDLSGTPWKRACQMMSLAVFGTCKNTPDVFKAMDVLGQQEVDKRLGNLQAYLECHGI